MSPERAKREVGNEDPEEGEERKCDSVDSVGLWAVVGRVCNHDDDSEGLR